MLTRVQDIRAVHWQPKLSAFGEVVEGLEDIGQCIGTILTTRKGSDPHRPEFGANVWKYIDWPIGEAIPHVIREAMDAVARWETRAEVVRVEPEIGNAHLTMRVVWRLAAGGDQAAEQVTEVTL